MRLGGSEKDMKVRKLSQKSSPKMPWNTGIPPFLLGNRHRFPRTEIVGSVAGNDQWSPKIQNLPLPKCSKHVWYIRVYIYNIHIVVVGIGQQPALHRSEVVKTPLLPSSGAATPHMTGETSQQSNLKIKSPQWGLTLHVQHCAPKAHRVVYLQVKGMGRPCHRLCM